MLKNFTCQRHWIISAVSLSHSAAAMASLEDQQDDPSQWTRIVRKGKKLRRQEDVLRLPLGGPPENFRPNEKPVLSVDDIKANHTKIVSQWQETECYTKLCGLIKDNAAAHANITRAVCLGLGAFDPEDNSWIAQRRSHIQMAAFLAIVEILGRSLWTPKESPCC